MMAILVLRSTRGLLASHHRPCTANELARPAPHFEAQQRDDKHATPSRVLLRALFRSLHSLVAPECRLVVFSLPVPGSYLFITRRCDERQKVVDWREDRSALLTESHSAMSSSDLRNAKWQYDTIPHYRLNTTIINNYLATKWPGYDFHTEVGRRYLSVRAFHYETNFMQSQGKHYQFWVPRKLTDVGDEVLSCASCSRKSCILIVS